MKSVKQFFPDVNTACKTSQGKSKRLKAICGHFNLLEAMKLGWGDSFDVLFATATCANSGMMGKMTTNPVPEPNTWILFGTGLLGIFWVARKKLAQKT